VPEGWHRRSYERDANGYVTSERYWAIDGEPATAGGCHEFRMDRDSRGRIQTTSCVGTDGQLAATSQGIPVWRRTYDADDDHVVEWSYFDGKGAPISNSEHFHREAVSYDDRGHVTGLAYSGPDGASVMRQGGYARVKVAYEGDKEVSRLYLDTKGEPTVIDSGYAERRREYDRNGNQILEAYFDAAGKPIAQSNHAVAERSVYDNCGQLTETWYLGPDGKPLKTTDLYAGVRYDLDRLGRTRGVTYLSEAGVPTLSTNMIAGWTARLDARGNRVEETYFGTDRRPIQHKNGYAAMAMTYDRRSNLVRMEYHRADGKLATTRSVPVEEYSFNERNERVHGVWSHFDKDGTFLGKEDFTYNELGQTVEKAYFDANNRAFALSDKDDGTCARVRYRYDGSGKITARECFGERDQPPAENAAVRR
jgi:hypothetical protein